jgi:hypothetical protein
MEMIKKIYVSGGSQCIAGGFMHDDVKKIYKEKFNIDIKNHLDFAYPNILAKKLDVDIVNEGAPGGSITRMMRKTYEYIIKNKKDINETLFIFEIPPYWRDEYYSNLLKRHINMTIGNINTPDDETEMLNGHNPKDLNKIHKDITNFFYNFQDEEIHNTKMMMNLLGFMSFIKLNNLNYILNDTGDFDAFLSVNNLEKNYNFLWFSDKWPYPMTQWYGEQRMSIKQETNRLSKDEHMGIKANELVAEKLYNMLNNINEVVIKKLL